MHRKPKFEYVFAVCPVCNSDRQYHEPGRYVCASCGAAPERVDDPQNREGKYPKALDTWITWSKEKRSKP